jgi:hypothetical protein
MGRGFLGFSYGFRPGRGQHDALDALWVGTWLAPLKGFTAYRANELLGNHGQAFWQDESYDHLVRSRAEFDRIRAYIEENPVTAGLVVDAQEYPWSSAAGRLKGQCHLVFFLAG